MQRARCLSEPYAKPPKLTPNPSPNPDPNPNPNPNPNLDFHPNPHSNPSPNPNPNQKVCKPCKLGSYCPSGVSVPKLCPKGFYGDGGEDDLGVLKNQPLFHVTQCKNCSDGMKCPAGSYCSDCLEGSYGQAKCAAGTYTDVHAPTPGERHVCIDCPEGTYQDSIQQTGCRPCKKGHYCLNASAAAR